MMSRSFWLGTVLPAVLMAASSSASTQTPYIGYVYPAGGRQGTTFDVRLGGQRLVDVRGAVISGSGVSAEVTKYYRRLSNQELNLLPLGQRAKSLTLNGRMMHEYVIAALALDEAKALGVVEPLDGSGLTVCHDTYVLPPNRRCCVGARR